MVTALSGLALGVAASAAADGEPLQLGVATHFEQGWPITWMGKAQAVGASAIRDDVSWGKLERRAGLHDWSAFDLSYIDKACTRGLNVHLVLVPRNPIYDGGDMVYTRVGQQAFASFVSALLDRQGSRCITGLEIGNEINGANAMPLPSGVDPARAYVALLDSLRSSIRQRHPDVAIVGGSTNVIGTGFLERLMAAGLLEKADAIAVHPYRSHPENVDLELRRLGAAMQRHGAVKPIWATEFGDYFEVPERAPGHMLKMLLLMATSGVTRADWYALSDEPWFKNMGLFDSKQRLKPAGQAFRFAQETILSGGAPSRLFPDDRRLFRFRLADGGTVIWGDPQPIRWLGRADVRDSRGSSIAPPQVIGDEPVVIAASTRFALQPGVVLADSFTQYGTAPWSYLARIAGTAPLPLTMIDWQWTSFYSRPELNPLAVTDGSTLPTGDARQPVSTVVRYTAFTDGPVKVSACFTSKRSANGFTLSIEQGGMPLFETAAQERLMIRTVQADLRAGETLDFIVRRPGGFQPDHIRYHIRILTPAADLAPDCLP